ncbi:MAG: SUF system NifU family Fe-S cluster assembly protein [Candidatus Wallbacteria bacterium]|nr:SUF system NifU family Fe-S cluster assembly protein [Candidatus Wallbacteria bacterium]MBI4868223.1 SUF system NifU family Fe-S cluster assembly protein [Candidatus Wallbacteria bacterium]
MSDLRDLYQEVILDHSKKPRNYRRMEDSCSRAEGFNPLCGDQLVLFVKVASGIIQDISFEGSGCAISKASASMMTGAVKGKTLEEADRVFEHFHKMVTGQPGDPFDAEILGKLAVFSGVCEFPARVKCASLAWHTLKAALKGEGQQVTTE